MSLRDGIAVVLMLLGATAYHACGQEVPTQRDVNVAQYQATLSVFEAQREINLAQQEAILKLEQRVQRLEQILLSKPVLDKAQKYLDAYGDNKPWSAEEQLNFPRKRSQSARRHFAQANPCPATGKNALPCPGYVIDHVIPLCAGGDDAPSNMQWQTVSDAKIKDREERKQCK